MSLDWKAAVSASCLAIAFAFSIAHPFLLPRGISLGTGFLFKRELYWIFGWAIPILISSICSLWPMTPKSFDKKSGGSWIERVWIPKKWKYARILNEHSKMDIFLLLAIILLNCYWCIYPIASWFYLRRDSNHSVNSILKTVGNYIGWASLWNMALTLLFCLRAIFPFHALHISYYRGIPFHRLLGWVTFWQVTVHSVLWALVYIRTDRFPKFILPGFPKGWVNFFGVIGTLALVVFSVMSLAWVRRNYFSWFIFVHQLYIVFIFATIWHISVSVFYLLPCVILLILDRILCWSSARSMSMEADLTCYPESQIIRIDLKQNLSKLNGSTNYAVSMYHPGDYIRVSIPSVNWTAIHPFSIGSWWHESPDRITLYVKKMDNWTKSLFDYTQQGGPHTVTAYVQEPFALKPKPSLHQAKTCIFFAGGVGIVPFVPELKSILHLHPNITRIHVHWSVRYIEALHPFADFIYWMMNHPSIELCLYVSQPGQNQTPYLLHSTEIKNDATEVLTDESDAITIDDDTNRNEDHKRRLEIAPLLPSEHIPTVNQNRNHRIRFLLALSVIAVALCVFVWVRFVPITSVSCNGRSPYYLTCRFYHNWSPFLIPGLAMILCAVISRYLFFGPNSAKQILPSPVSKSARSLNNSPSEFSVAFQRGRMNPKLILEQLALQDQTTHDIVPVLVSGTEPLVESVREACFHHESSGIYEFHRESVEV